MKKQLNFAIVGVAGYIAPRHMKAIKDLGHRIVAGYDVNDSVGIIDSISPDAHFFLDFERFFDFCAEFQDANAPGSGLDYVVVCSPNYLHRAHISAGLRLGCDVICEKPLVPSIQDINYLSQLEQKFSRKVWNILQLRHHAAVAELRKKIEQTPADHVFDVDLTYITSRGRWYMESWKGNPNKSFGIEMNIGIHFFDLLHHLFGSLLNLEYHYSSDYRASGYLVYERAKVRWFLSIDGGDVALVSDQDMRTYRSITIDGEELEFSEGFTELHTVSYDHIMRQAGFGLEDARHCIDTVSKLRSSAPKSTTDQQKMSQAMIALMK